MSSRLVCACYHDNMSLLICLIIFSLALSLSLLSLPHSLSLSRFLKVTLNSKNKQVWGQRFSGCTISSTWENGSQLSVSGKSSLKLFTFKSRGVWVSQCFHCSQFKQNTAGQRVVFDLASHCLHNLCPGGRKLPDPSYTHTYIHQTLSQKCTT